jgi:hypothetical protein
LPHACKGEQPPVPDVDEPKDSHVAPEAERQFQKTKRTATNWGIFAGSDTPAMLSIAVGFNWLHLPGPLESAVLLGNAIAGYVSIASDFSLVRDSLRNPDLPKKDKVMDCAHLVNDFTNTGSSMLPLFFAMHGPFSVVGGIFAGGQILGTIFDGAKLVWDKHRGGEQSALCDAGEPKRMVMDRTEKRLGQMPMAMGMFGCESLIFPNAAWSMGGALATTMAGIGGSFGAVYGFTQLRKSKLLTKKLEALKANGVEGFDMPKWTKKGVEYHHIKVDEALATTKRRKWGAIGQMAASTVMMAAGCVGFAPLAIAAVAASTLVGVATVGAEVYAHRDTIAAKLHHMVDGVKARFSKHEEPAQIEAPADDPAESSTAAA